jgi:transglutaminase-like putative cysteine protease
MDLYRYYITSSYALLATSFGMLVATRRLEAVTTLLFAGALVVGWMVDTNRLAWAVPRAWANGLMVVGLTLALAEWQFLGVPTISAIIHLTLFASSLKLLRWKSRRDWLWLYVVSFCLVLMTAGMTMDAAFLLLLVVYLFAALSTFVIHEIRRSQLDFAEAHSRQNPGAGFRFDIQFWRESKGARDRVSPPGGRGLLSSSALMLAMILLVAAPLFLAMPRVTRGHSRGGLLGAETLTGFSDSVRLGQVAQVKLNPQVVMRVRVKFPPLETRRALRWRGVTLDHYDGQIWFQSGREPAPVRRIGDTFRVDEQLWTRGYTEQRFFLEPLGINTVFAAPRPVLVTGLGELARDGGDGLWAEDHLFHKLDYVVYSDTGLPTDAELAAAGTRAHPAELHRRYTQLPDEHDRRIDKLAEEVTRGAATNIEIARRIEKHLSTSYSYTLDLTRVEEGEPVADFLFNVKAGHCEYFASAMVLMLRTRRIPARLVNGFQTGEYNQTADFYTVRQSDAHSWVEVHFPKYGWIAFDPTPPAGLSAYGDGWAARMREWREAMEMFWLEHVVGFDTGKQISMARAAQDWLAFRQFNLSSRWSDWASEIARGIERWRERDGETRFAESRPAKPSSSGLGKIALTVFGIAGLIGLVMVLRNRGSWRRKIKSDSTASAIAFYEEMLRALERRKVNREPDQTPAEFAAQVAIDGVTEITHLYQRTRFGDKPLTEDEIARIDSLLRELKKWPLPQSSPSTQPSSSSAGSPRAKSKKALRKIS